MSARTRTPEAGAVVVAIPAGGQPGGDELLWVEVAGRPLIAWTIAAFERSPAIAATVLVLPLERVETADTVARHEDWRRTQAVVGGPRWQDAVLTGVVALPAACRWVVVQDGTRPLLTPALIAAGITAARPSGAASASAPVKETLKRVERGLVVATPPRDRLALLQTPQVFERTRLVTLIQRDASAADVSDLTGHALDAGSSVATFPAGRDSLKVVTPDDFAVAAGMLRARLQTEQHS